MVNKTKIQLIQKIARRLAPKYTFGYYDVEDIEQEAVIIGLEALQYYDSKIGSLSTFLYYHINNRLKNFLRDNFHRKRSSCPRCGRKTPSPECDSCLKYEWRTESKRNLLEPLPLDLVSDDEKSIQVYNDVLSIVEDREILSIIDGRIPIQLRSDYIRIKDGATLSYMRKQKVVDAIMEILLEYR